MTQRHNTGWLKVCSQSAMGLVLGAVVGTAQASGTMSGYQDDVESLDAALGSLVESYRADTQAGDELATFKQQWESVEYHEAVEDNAKPLYPLIWQAIGQLENTLDDSAAPSAVEGAADRVRATLWQGLGALRLATSKAAGQPQEGSAESGETPITAIKEALDEALGEYYEGEIDEAKTLVSDAYMQRFEGLEGGLIELDPELVEGLEEDFNASLPNAMESGKDEQVATLVKSMKARLDQSRELLAGQESVEVF